jgi:hypothetical protein
MRSFVSDTSDVLTYQSEETSKPKKKNQSVSTTSKPTTQTCCKYNLDCSRFWKYSTLFHINSWHLHHKMFNINRNFCGHFFLWFFSCIKVQSVLKMISKLFELYAGHPAITTYCMLLFGEWGTVWCRVQMGSFTPLQKFYDMLSRKFIVHWNVIKFL